MTPSCPLSNYLADSQYIDCQHPSIIDTAHRLKSSNETDTARHCFEFVRDTIKHTWDYRIETITCKASDVLAEGTGYCYAKSHLLAALLRANDIPAGLCYQRLSINDDGPPYCLHGLNAVFLPDIGWYRVDPRGNKSGIDAQFKPPAEQLAFAINDPYEADLQGIWPEPLPVVIDVLTRYNNRQAVADNLPDVEIIPGSS